MQSQRVRQFQNIGCEGVCDCQPLSRYVLGAHSLERSVVVEHSTRLLTPASCFAVLVKNYLIPEVKAMNRDFRTRQD
jgi:hypothetical protein